MHPYLLIPTPYPQPEACKHVQNDGTYRLDKRKVRTSCPIPNPLQHKLKSDQSPFCAKTRKSKKKGRKQISKITRKRREKEKKRGKEEMEEGKEKGERRKKQE